MIFNYTSLELENKKSHNTSVFRKSYIALRRGIQSIYYREDNERDTILKIYDNNAYYYMDYIYDIIIAKIKFICNDYSKNVMFNNMLILILLFFIVDYRNLENKNIEKIDEFLNLIVNEGLKYNLGNGYFQLNLNIVLQILNLDIHDFTNLLLLKNPSISIFYNKKNGDRDSPLLIETAKIDKDNNIQNISLSPIHIKEEPINNINNNNNNNTLNNQVLEQNIIETQMNILSLEVLRLRELLGKSMEQNGFLTGLNNILIQQKEVLIQEIENVKTKNKQLTIENDFLKKDRDLSFENDFTKSLTFSIFN